MMHESINKILTDYLLEQAYEEAPEVLEDSPGGEESDEYDEEG